MPTDTTALTFDCGCDEFQSCPRCTTQLEPNWLAKELEDVTMPNPVAEVVERLREHAEYCRQLDSGSGDAKVFDAAANEIESLRIEVHAIKYEVMGGEDVPGSANAATVDDVRNEIARLVGQNRDAQAEIERLSRERDTGVPEALSILEDICSDFMTSETHHPDHVLIRKDAFERALVALSAAPQPPTVSTQGWPEGASSDLPDEIYVERDAETNEKRWFSCKGMGEKYVHARLLDNWKFVAKYGLAKVTPEHTWAQWLAEMKADLSALTRERDQAREALAPFVSGPRHEIRRVSSLDDNCGTFIHVEVRESDLDRACSIIQRSDP